MGTYFGYARVSTPRQGEKGVSLQEQKSAIERYAAIHGLGITRWFEERESASSAGRPAFGDMLRLLRLGNAQGVIIHKIDRSARNMQDWADVGKLADAGVEVHFATENVDLKTVTGRLSADIQAVVAAHYSRNLREEVKKGLYGRLKQGFYPFRAPIGYLDQGKAKVKIPDPVRAPLIREAFSLYCSGKFSLPDLAEEMFRKGLRNRNGRHVTQTGITTVLKNPFYIGLMRIDRNGQTFPGIHEPLITTEIFEKTQAVLAGKRTDRSKSHCFTYSRIVRCKRCGYSLIAELQKGHVYYRCHNRPFKKDCPPTAVREEHIDAVVLSAFAAVDFAPGELQMIQTYLSASQRDAEKDRAARIVGLRLQLDQLQVRLEKLADTLIDGTIEKDLFKKKQADLLLGQARLKGELVQAEKGVSAAIEDLGKIVELAKSPSVLYKTASLGKRRELLKILLSNLQVAEKNVELTLALPFRIIAERQKPSDGAPHRGTCRTWEQIVKELQKHFENAALT